MRWLLETPESVEIPRRGPVPLVVLTALLLVGLIVGSQVLTQAPPPPPPSPNASTNPTLVQKCRAQEGFDPSLCGCSETGDPARLLVFYNSPDRPSCAARSGAGGTVVGGPARRVGGQPGQLFMNAPDQVAILVGRCPAPGTVRATLLGATGGHGGLESDPVWWMATVLPVESDEAAAHPVHRVRRCRGTAETWLVPWVGAQVDESKLDWADAAGRCGAALHSDQPTPGLRLLIPGPGGPLARGFLVVSLDNRLWTCAVGAQAGWIGTPSIRRAGTEGRGLDPAGDGLSADADRRWEGAAQESPP